MGWVQISCAERDRLVDDVYMNGRAADFRVLTSGRDTSGGAGRPRIEIVWGDEKTEIPVVRDVRNLDQPVESAHGCEHYRYEEDGDA